MKLASTLLLFMLQFLQALSGQFASHIRVTTPAHSYSHGVGDPVSHSRRHIPPIKDLRFAQEQIGYPRHRPSIPFQDEETPTIISWQGLQNAEKIPLLPPSPYKVDSPDPESLWPEGLFIPPQNTRLDIQRRSSHLKNAKMTSNDDSIFLDPYLLQGSEAIQAVEKSKRHGELYFHDIPHIKSLLSNQEHRVKNNLKPHRLGSIRHTWPFNRL